MNYCFQKSIDNIELGTDIYMFIRKLYLTYHFCDSTDEDKWNIKSTSTFKPKFIKETIFKKPDRKKKTYTKRTSDNVSNLREGLNSNRSNEIIQKPAFNRYIVIAMAPKYYWKMYQSDLNNEQYYQCVFEKDPLLIISEKIINYVNKY